MNKDIEPIDIENTKENAEEKTNDNNASLDESMNKYDSDEESYQKPDEEDDYKEDTEMEESIKNKNSKNSEEDLNIGSVISKIKDFDNNAFKYEHLLYQDNYIIDEIKSFNAETNYKVNSLQQLFLKVLQQLSFEDIHQSLFYNEVFIYLLKKNQL